MKVKSILTLITSVLIFAPQAKATVLFSDTFDSQTTGVCGPSMTGGWSNYWNSTSCDSSETVVVGDSHGSGATNKSFRFIWPQAMSSHGPSINSSTYGIAGRSDVYIGYRWKHNAGWNWGSDDTHKWIYLPKSGGERTMLSLVYGNVCWFDGAAYNLCSTNHPNTDGSSWLNDSTWHNYVIWAAPGSHAIKVWYDGTELTWNTNNLNINWTGTTFDSGNGDPNLVFGYQSRPNWGAGNTSYFDDVIVATTKAEVDALLGTTTGGDASAPTVTTFTMPSTASNLTVNVTSLAATDNTAVTGYCITTTNSSSGCSWNSAAPNAVTVSSPGTVNWYAWAKDAAGNVSSAKTASTIITLADSSAPTVPTALTATTVSSSQINLSWAASTDNVGVAGYKVYCNGTYIATSTTTSYSNTGLTASTNYSYTVSAVDAAGNTSSQSSSASATTQSASSDGSVLFTEDFENTNFSAKGWYDQTNFVTTTDEHITGSNRAAAFIFTSGATKPTSGGGIRRLFDETDSVYIGYWVKYPSNWKEQSGGYGHHEIYLLTNQDSTYNSLAFSRLTTYLEHWGTYNQAVSLTPDISFQDGVNIDQNNINVNLTAVSENRATSGCNGASDSNSIICYDGGGGTYYNGKTIPGVAGSLTLGDWHHVEAFIKLNSIVNNKGVADGIVQYWIDGNQKINKNNVMMRTAQYPKMKFNQIIFAPYMGNGSPQAQTFWIDDLQVTTYSPGSSILSAPTAATIISVSPN
jgi:hypothetical protein